MAPRPRSLAVAFLAVAAVVLGVGFVVDEYRTATGAVETTGTVESAAVETVTRVRPTLSGQTEYRANVSYTYTVDGTRYRNDAVFLGSYSYAGDGREVALAASDYAPGESVTVHYLPGDPDRAFLIARYSFLPGYALVAFGLLLLGEFLTPGTWLIDWLRRRVTDDRSDDEPHRYDWEESPEAVGDGAETAPAVDGPTAVGVWTLVALGVLGATGHYLLVSVPPYSPLTVGAVVVGIGFPVARVVATRP